MKNSIFLRRSGVAIAAAMIALIAVLGVTGTQNAFATIEASTGPDQVVQLDSTTSAGLVTAYTAAGKTVIFKTAAQWGAMTTADFASYDAVVL